MAMVRGILSLVSPSTLGQAARKWATRRCGIYFSPSWRRDGLLLWSRNLVGRGTSFQDWPGYVEPADRFRDDPFGQRWPRTTKPATWATRRGLLLRVALLWVPRDAWVGLYFPKRSSNGGGGPLHFLYSVYVCAVPFFPVRVTLGLPEAWGDLLQGAVERRDGARGTGPTLRQALRAETLAWWQGQR